MVAQEREIERIRDALKHEQHIREKKFLQELEEREKMFSERERVLFDRQREMEDVLRRRHDEVDYLRHKLEVDISKKEAELAEKEQGLESEKARYTEEGLRNLESKSRSYVSDAISSLERNEDKFHSLAKVWGGVGVFSLVAGVVFFSWISIVGASSVAGSPSWELIAFLTLKGVISVAILGALARYAFMFSRSYMHEALKNGDRRHAINFGKFYLETYGAAADWVQIKEAFEHWNISSGSAFSGGQESKAEAEIAEKVAGAVVDRFAKFGEKLVATPENK